MAIKSNLAIVGIFFLQLTVSFVIPKPLSDEPTKFLANQTAEVNFGDNIILECKLPELSWCGWQRRGVLINPVVRYRFVNGDGTNTKDCSLRIDSVQEIDLGEWKCESLGTSEKLSTEGCTVQITRKNPNGKSHIQPKISTTMINPPQDHPVTEGNTIEITTENYDDDIHTLNVESGIIIAGLVVVAVLLAALVFILTHQWKLFNCRRNPRQQNQPNQQTSILLPDQS